MIDPLYYFFIYQTNRLSELASVCMCRLCSRYKKKRTPCVEQPVRQERNKSRKANMAADKHIPFGSLRRHRCPYMSQRVSISVTGPLSVFSLNNKAFLPHRETLVASEDCFFFFFQGTVEHLKFPQRHPLLELNMPGHVWKDHKHGSLGMRKTRHLIVGYNRNDFIISSNK